MFGSSNGAMLELPNSITVVVGQIISFSQVKPEAREGGDHVFTVTTGATGHRLLGTKEELEKVREGVAKAIEKHYS